jgi:hypothetical protein
MTAGVDLRPRKLMWGSACLLMEITLKEITYRYNNFVSKVFF